MQAVQPAAAATNGAAKRLVFTWWQGETGQAG